MFAIRTHSSMIGFHSLWGHPRVNEYCTGYGCDNRGSRGPRASVNRICMYAGPVSWVSNSKHWL